MSDDKQEQQDQPPAENKADGLIDAEGRGAQEASSQDDEGVEGTAPPEASSVVMKWYFEEDGQRKGPIDEAEIRRMYGAGEITASTKVWHKGLSDWLPVAAIEDIAVEETPTGPLPAADLADYASSAAAEAGVGSEPGLPPTGVGSEPGLPPTGVGSEPELPPTSEVRIQSSAARREAAFKAFPVQKNHASARSLVVDVEVGDVDLKAMAATGSSSQNILATVLIVGITAVGMWQLNIVSSEEVLAAKRAERQAIEEQFLAEQMAKQKRYGILRIESTPAQATVVKDGEAIVVKTGDEDEEGEGVDGTSPTAPGNAAVAPGADGTEEGPRAGTTPMNLMNVDIGQTYKFKVSKEGYESFDFAVAEHLWTKDAGEYKFIKMIELIPINCEYWFLYDAKKRREVQFEQKLGCMDHYKQSVANLVSVTECACKFPPPGATPEGQPGATPQ